LRLVKTGFRQAGRIFWMAYKHLLLPTDGSKLAAKGIREGVRLAKALGASVTGVYVAPPFVAPIRGEAAAYYAGPYSQGEYKRLTETIARKALDTVKRAAGKAGVSCRTRLIADPQPWTGILRAARAWRCDAIVMASHGHGAVGGLLLGSETSRVLAHSKLPVLVVR
jgi:nucleotide-binding universal stress UspA family protein